MITKARSLEAVVKMTPTKEDSSPDDDSSKGESTVKSAIAMKAVEHLGLAKNRILHHLMIQTKMIPLK